MNDVRILSQMRVGIKFRRFTVRCPAGVSDTDRESGTFKILSFFFKVDEFSNRFK